jgi:hypothetical protein
VHRPEPLRPVFFSGRAPEPAEKLTVERHEMNLAVGDSLQIGDRLMTVIDIEGDEVSFRIDQIELDCLETASNLSTTRPRK